jgi:hypothetical protein
VTTWRRDRALSAEMAARMDLAALVPACRTTGVPSDTDLRLWCAVETLVLLTEEFPEVLDALLAAAPEEVLAGASHRLVRKSELFLLLHHPRKSGPKPEKGHDNDV